MNTYVNFEIAKLLKEKGFKQPCFYYYDKNVKLNEPYLENGSSTDVEFRVDLTDFLGHHNSYSTQYISVPTIAEAVMWLYEKHKIWIHCEICFDGNSFIPKITKVVENLYPFDTQFKSPTEAYEAAIKHTLENLI